MVIEKAKEGKTTPRNAALILAQKRVKVAMEKREP